MDPFWWIVLIVIALVFGPIWIGYTIYLCVKFYIVGYYSGHQQINKGEKTNG